VRIQKLQIRNFRCFSQHDLIITNDIVLLIGPNGSGKTSILEALHYICYLRSFRAASPKDLVAFEQENFFLKALIVHNHVEEHEIQIGFSRKKKLVRVDQRSIDSYKELHNYYKIVTLTEDDLDIIKGAPEVRRTYIDQAVLLHDSDYSAVMRTYKTILNNRNALLAHSYIDMQSYRIWTEQLWQQSRMIQDARNAVLQKLEATMNRLLAEYVSLSIQVSLCYSAKKNTRDVANCETFLNENNDLYDQEKVMRRTLFGSHLDDMLICYKNVSSRSFASRGQQKLVVLLLKVAQILELHACNQPVIFLLDDFLTDFDPIICQKLIALLTTLSIQLIFTCPAEGSIVEDLLREKNAQIIKLTG
jgi:DNA replication and repair protein RecF